MRVVVTGGTGFIGRALVRALAERGDDTVVLTRGAPGGRCPGPRRGCQRGAGTVTLKEWTPERAGDWQRVVDDADAVVHLAGAPVLDGRWTPERRRVLRDSRVVSTELLADALVRAPSRPRVLVSSSAVGYYGTAAGTRELSEDDPPGDDFLATLCRDWEAAARGAGAAARVAMPRIGVVLGRGAGALAKMLPAFKAYVGGPVGDGEQPVPWIHVEDTVRALLFALDTPKFEGAFNVTSPEPTTMNGLARALGDALGRPSAFRVPAALVKIALGDAAVTVLTGQRALPKRLVAAGFAFVFPDLRSALADVLSQA